MAHLVAVVEVGSERRLDIVVSDALRFRFVAVSLVLCIMVILTRKSRVVIVVIGLTETIGALGVSAVP